MPKLADKLRPFEVMGSADFTFAAGDDDGKQKRPTFKINAYDGAPMRVAYYYRPVIIDLAGLRANPTIPILLEHDREQIVGQGEPKITAKKIGVTGAVTGRDEASQRVTDHAQDGFKWGASVGVSPEALDDVGEGESVKVNGRSWKGPLTVVKQARLGEVSFVVIGACETATVEIKAARAAVNGDSDMDFNAWLQAAGIDPESLNEDETKAKRAEYDAEMKASTPKPAPKSKKPAPKQIPAPAPDEVNAAVSEMREEAAAESRRIASIRKICAGQHPDIEAKAIEEGWNAERVELEQLRASRPQAPAVHSRDNPITGQVLEAACMLTAGLTNVEQAHDEQTLEAAGRRFRGGIGLQELLLEAAWANGYTGRVTRPNKELMRYAFGQDIQAGFSTIGIDGILSNVANKFLLEGFFMIERVWRTIAAIRNVSDFKAVTSYRLVGKDQYEEVGPTGELKHGTLGEETYTNKAKTYGLMLTVTRQDIINDDLGAITTVPRKLGRGSGLKLNDVFWAKFLANTAFFKAANKNYFTGAGTALGIDGLTQAEQAFMDQVDTDGKPIGFMPAILLVPTALSAMSAQLNKSLEMRDTTTDIKYPINNPHAGKFRPEVSRYLGNTSYTGNSSKAWYLLADPSDVAVIEVAFLNGQESPTIESAEADFNVLGIQMRGYHDFGVELQDPRSGVKMKGEA